MPDAWLDIVARLALSAVVGAAIGLNRDLHHKQAGVRTNALVSLGAALADSLAGAIVECARWHATPEVVVGRCAPKAFKRPLLDAVKRRLSGR